MISTALSGFGSGQVGDNLPSITAGGCCHPTLWDSILLGKIDSNSLRLVRMEGSMRSIEPYILARNSIPFKNISILTSDIPFHPHTVDENVIS